jgi:hypothetical protein
MNVLLVALVLACFALLNGQFSRSPYLRPILWSASLFAFVTLTLGFLQNFSHFVSLRGR